MSINRAILSILLKLPELLKCFLSSTAVAYSPCKLLEYSGRVTFDHGSGGGMLGNILKLKHSFKSFW
jgi:hypothetical protein